jgi:hypothetical protein
MPTGKQQPMDDMSVNLTGGDIVFTSSDGTTKLDHEIETYVTST